MWEIMQTNRKPQKSSNPIAFLPVMLVGAGIGIATWEVIKRRNIGVNNSQTLVEKMEDVLEA
nr:hypothetical protein [Bacilli bacterium]